MNACDRNTVNKGQGLRLETQVGPWGEGLWSQAVGGGSVKAIGMIAFTGGSWERDQA